MTSPDLAPEIVAWFGSDRRPSLSLPTGWFGRPYDNVHTLRSAHTFGGRLILELDETIVLLMVRPLDVVVEPGLLRIQGFSGGVMSHDSYGSSEPHLTVFGAGEVQFHDSRELVSSR